MKISGFRSFGPMWIATVVLAAGCTPKGSSVVEGSRKMTSEKTQPQMAWPAWYPHAVDLRLHPASRYIRTKDAKGEVVLQLETRIELLDQFNEPIKDIGKIEIEMRMLDAKGRLRQDAKGRQRGFRWVYDLTTPDQQKAFWDPIARAYKFACKIDPIEKAVLDSKTVLRVTFTPAWPNKPRIPTGHKAQQILDIQTEW